MKPETKAMLKTLIGREPDETDQKIFEVLMEAGLSEEKQHPVKFSLDFGKRCYEMGKDDNK